MKREKEVSLFVLKYRKLCNHITARSVSDTRISGERAVGIKEGLIFYNSMFDNGLRRIEIGALINNNQ
jgi:hypothetical protein